MCRRAEQVDQTRQRIVEATVELHGSGGAGDERHRLRAAVGHAVSFWTWRSPCLDQGLTDTVAVAFMTGMVLAVTPMSAEPAR
jgi:DNA-binding transcriptional regulator YbjK